MAKYFLMSEKRRSSEGWKIPMKPLKLRPCIEDASAIPDQKEMSTFMLHRHFKFLVVAYFTTAEFKDDDLIFNISVPI